MPDEQLRLLVVGGHPADVFDHCGGTLALHARRGDSVTALALTQGLRIHDVVISERMRFATERPQAEELDKLLQERQEAKYAEVRKACGLLGITDVCFLSYDDKTLLVTSPLIEAVARVIREVKPDIILTHYPLEEGGIGSHHANAGKIVMDAVAFAGTVDFDDPHPAHRTPQVFFMAPGEATFRGTALAGGASSFCDYYVDITPVVEEKVRALDSMRSQQYGGNYARRSVEVWNGKDGFYLGIPYAESFIRCYPEVGDGLTVSPYRRQKANEPELETLHRMSTMIAPFVQLPED